MTTAESPFEDPNVEAAFQAFDEGERAELLKLRGLIFGVAAETPGVGALQETLKWGQPAYLTPETKSGSTIRLGVPKTGGVAIYTHCQSTIMSEFQSLFPDDFAFEGNRGVHFDAVDDVPVEGLRMLIRSALTYHQKKRSTGR